MEVEVTWGSGVGLSDADNGEDGGSLRPGRIDGVCVARVQLPYHVSLGFLRLTLILTV